jgi:hypothetical protein
MAHAVGHHDFQVVKGTNPSSVSVELVSFNIAHNNTVVPAVFNQTASAGNPHLDVWSVNVTDQNAITFADSFVPALSRHGVAGADANVRSGS